MGSPRNFITIFLMIILVSASLITGSVNLLLPLAAPAAPVGISFYPSGGGSDNRELSSPILCGSKGSLAFAAQPQVSATWTGVAIEVPREFSGLVDGVTVNVKSTITNNYTYIKVIDEARYHPYNMSAPFWVEVGNPSGFSNLRYVFIEGLVAPSIASTYIFKCYYSFIQPTTTHPTTFDYSSLLPIKDSNKPLTYYTLIVPVSMCLDPAAIYCRIVDNFTTGLGLKNPITTRGIVTASQSGNVVAKALVNPVTGGFDLIGLAPGTYKLAASAGYWNATNYAYPVTELYTLTLGRGQSQSYLDLILPRAGNVSGTINWETAPPFGHPFGVEVYDSAGILKGSYSGASAGSTIDYWMIKESPDRLSGFSDGNYTVKVWAYGYTQKTAMNIRVLRGMAPSVSIQMVTGGVITGSITYSKAPPLQGKIILVEAYNVTGVLKGVYIGTTSGASSDTFRIRGFSETQGETDLAGGQVLASYSGRGYKDSGLSDGVYKLKAWVVGYLNPTAPPTVTISNRSTMTTAIPLIKGGEISGKVLSKNPDGADNRFSYHGAPLRIYFYDSAGRSMGYTSVTQLATATNVTYGPFSGFTWRSLDIGYIRMGYHDTALANGTYTVKAYTKGYIQMTYPNVTISGSGSQYFNCAIFQGGRVHVTVTFRSGTYVKSVRELVSLEIYDLTGVLRGVGLYEMTTMSSIISYDIFGFYSCANPNGTPMMDYGLPDGNYRIKAIASSIEVSGAPDNIPMAFISFTNTTTFNFTITKGGTVNADLSLFQTGLIYGAIMGYTVSYSVAPTRLSWASVNSSTVKISTSTLNGDYYIGLPEGSHNVTISYMGYQNYTATIPITGGTYSQFSLTLAPVKPCLIVSFRATPNPLNEAAGQLSATCRAFTTTSDGSTPSLVRYAWKCSGGSLNSTTGATIKWTSPTVFDINTYRITCSASASGYENGSYTETLIVHPIPEFPLGATLTLIAALGLALYLSRLFRKPPVVSTLD